MKKLLSLLLAAALLTGCAEKTESAKDASASTTSGTDASSVESAYDPFAREDSGSGTEARSYSYGVNWKDGKEFVLDYASTVSFDYFVENDNTTTDFGLLLFVNGISQPYRTDAEPENKTMHIFNVNGSEKKTQTISFEAVTGEDGEELWVDVVSMLQPDYVQETNAYYGLISSLYPSKLLVTEKTGKTDPKICTDYVTEQISDEMRQKFGTMGEKGGAGKNSLDQNTTIEALKNGVLITPAERLQKGENKLDITPFQTSDFVELCMYGGKTPCKYRVSMYVNHELVKGAFDGADFIDMTASRDEICRKKLVLSELGLTLNEWNHLYFVAVPFYTDDNFEERMVLKSPSVTLAGKK